MPRSRRPLLALAALVATTLAAGCATDPDEAPPTYAESAAIVLDWLPEIEGIDSVDDVTPLDEVDDTSRPRDLEAQVDPTLDVDEVAALVDEVARRLGETVHARGGVARVDLRQSEFGISVSSYDEPGDERFAHFLRILGDDRVVAGSWGPSGFTAEVADASLAADVAADLWSDLPDRRLTVSSRDGTRTLQVSGDHAFPSVAADVLDAAAASSGLGGRVSVDHDSGTATLALVASPGFDAALLPASIMDAEAQGVEVTHVSQGPVSIARGSFDDAAIAIMRTLDGATGIERLSLLESASVSGSTARAATEDGWRLLHATLAAHPSAAAVEVSLGTGDAWLHAVSSPPLAADDPDLALLTAVLRIEGATARLRDGVLDLSLSDGASAASASALADAFAASPRTSETLSILGLQGEDEASSHVVHVDGGIAATVGAEPDPRATAFVERWGELRGDAAVGAPLERVP